MVRRASLVVLIGFLLVASCAAQKAAAPVAPVAEDPVAVPKAAAPVAPPAVVPVAVPKAAPKAVTPVAADPPAAAPAPVAVTPTAVAPAPVAVTPAAVPVAPTAACTTCADAFRAAGWNLATIPAAILTELVDATAVVTCFVPPAAALATLAAQFTQLKVPKATQAALYADVIKYHISSPALKLAITPATIDASTPITMRSALTCSTNKVIASPDATGAGLVLVDGAANKVAAATVPGTCKTVAAYSIPDVLSPCDSIKGLAAGSADPAADPTDPADPAADPTPDPAADPTADPVAPAVNPLATGDCLDQVLGAVGCVTFAKLLKCTKLQSILVQGTSQFTVVCPIDAAIAQSTLTCTASTLEATLDGMRYHIIPGKPKPWATASSTRGTAYPTLKNRAECNQNQLVFTEGAGGDDTVTGSAFSGNVVAKDKVACKGKLRVIAIDRTMKACCISRADDIKKLAVTTDPMVRKFIIQFISLAGAPGAGGTLFLPQPLAIAQFIAEAKATKFNLTDGVIREIAAFHLTTSTIRVQTDLAAQPFKEDTSQLLANTSMTVCSAADPSWSGKLMIQTGDTAQEASAGGSVLPKGAYTVTASTGTAEGAEASAKANLLQMRQNCDGVIYIIDKMLRPCPSVASNATVAETPVDPLGGGLGGATPGLGDPLGGGGTISAPGAPKGSTSGLGGGLGGNTSGLGAFGLGALTSPTGSAAAGVSASGVVVALAAVLAAALALLA